MKGKKIMMLMLIITSIEPVFSVGRIQIGDLYYLLDSTKKTAEVICKSYSNGKFNTDWNITAANIPSTVLYEDESYSVTSIGDYAFCSCQSLTSVTIPNSIESIGGEVFYNCSSLKTPVYSDTIFAYLPVSFKGVYAVPDGIKYITGGAFKGCKQLTNVQIPGSVSCIGYDAFEGCTSLPIFDYIRYADTYLVEVIDKTKPSYTIKEGTRWINKNAFYGCHKMTTISIPSSVISIGFGNFNECYELSSIIVENGNPRYDSRNNCNAIIETATNTLARGCKSTNIPDEITQIGDCAFNGCAYLHSIILPDSIKRIGDLAFTHSGLESIQIPSGVTSIGNQAFGGCSLLKNIIVLGETPPSIGDTPFDSYVVNIFVPCGTLSSYLQEWPLYGRKIGHKPLDFSITSAVNIEGAGYVVIPYTVCDSLMSAVPYYGYYFKEWSDGVVDNPRTIMPTQDTSFTAIFAPRKFTITFINDDMSILSSQLWDYGAIPSCEQPTKAEDEEYIYTFSGWTPEVVPVVADATYKASYTAKQKAEGIGDLINNPTPYKITISGLIFIQRGDKTYTVTGQEVR